MKQEYRITWVHEVIIEAESEEKARGVWENLLLGNLNKQAVNGKILSHSFVEERSFSAEDKREA